MKCNRSDMDNSRSSDNHSLDNSNSDNRSLEWNNLDNRNSASSNSGNNNPDNSNWPRKLGSAAYSGDQWATS